METKVGKYRSYINANKLANVKRDIMKNDRFTAVELKEIKAKIRQPTNTEQQNLEDAIAKVRQGNKTNNINPSAQQEEQFEEN